MSDRRKDNEASVAAAVILLVAVGIIIAFAFAIIAFLSVCAISVFRLKKQTVGFNAWDYCSLIAGGVMLVWLSIHHSPEMAPAAPYFIAALAVLCWFCLVNLREIWLIGERLSNGERFYNLFWGDLRSQMSESVRLLDHPEDGVVPSEQVSSSTEPRANRHPDSDEVQPRRRDRS